MKYMHKMTVIIQESKSLVYLITIYKIENKINGEKS